MANFSFTFHPANNPQAGEPDQEIKVATAREIFHREMYLMYFGADVFLYVTRGQLESILKQGATVLEPRPVTVEVIAEPAAAEPAAVAFTD